jgi:starvation-inducible DNA-binding protein
MLANLMKILLASDFSYYLKAHFFHWNIEGKDFYQYHKFLQKVYEDAYEAVDTIAEFIRTLDEYAPGSLVRYHELTRIKDQTKVPRAQLMMEELLSDSHVMVTLLNECFAAAEAENKQDVANFIAERLTAHNKFIWMYQSFLRESRA